MVESLVALEREAFLWLNAPHTPYLDSVMYLISNWVPWTIFFILFIFSMTAGQKRNESLLLLFGLLLVVFLADGTSSGIIKPLFQRLRPTHHPLTEDLVQTVLGYKGGNYGFVSGHSANFFGVALFTSLVIRHRGYTIISHIVALTVAYSRIYLGVHFITDVLPGILLGLLCGWVGYILYRESRITFLDVERDLASNSYLRPRERRTFMAYLMLGFYIVIWVGSPLLIKLYS